VQRRRRAVLRQIRGRIPIQDADSPESAISFEIGL
jgi:hypothetical protein